MTSKVLKRVLVSSLALIGLVFYIWTEVNIPAVRNVVIPIKGFPEEIKLVHISDAHGRGIKENGRLSRAIKSFGPDAIVLTGDMIDKSTVDFLPTLKTIKSLSSMAPVIFIPGNHERANAQGEGFIGLIRETGASVLLNGAKMVKGVSICGVDDMNFFLDDIPKSMAVNGRCDILLSHSPAISKAVENFDIPLVLSGHTHGGQVRLPVVGALLLPDRDIPRHLVKGLVDGGNSKYYISVGLGTSVAPIRFMNRAEVSLITVIPE